MTELAPEIGLLGIPFVISPGIKKTVSTVGNKFFPRIYNGTIADRFWSKVFPEPNSGCWIWCGDTNEHYGSFGLRMGGKQVRVQAHRFSYHHLVSRIDDGLSIDHKCENKYCVNPDHLRAVTPWENTMATPPGRRGNHQISTHCKHGHALTGPNLYFDTRGNAVCRICRRARWRAYDAKNPRRRLNNTDRLNILARRLTCACGCGNGFGSIKDVEFDHIVPLSKGGSEDDCNFQPLLKGCHKNKTYGADRA